MAAENTIEATLNDRLKSAMRDKNQPVLDVVRAIRGKVTEARTAKGFNGVVDDALYVTLISAYVKQMTKALEEFTAAGDRGKELADKLRFEIGYLEEFVPKRLGEAETRAIVASVIAATGATSKKEIGKVMGGVMKTHKDQVDPALVRAAAEALLD